MFTKKELYESVLNVCHRRPERSFFWKGKQFPVCARCTGTALGFVTLPLFALKILSFNFLWVLLLMLPCWVDGVTQLYGWRQSNNWLRLATGFLLGTAQMGLVAIVGDWIVIKTGIINLFS